MLKYIFKLLVGLNDDNVFGKPLVDRQAVWIVPSHLFVENLKGSEKRHASPGKTEDISYSIADCTLKAYKGEKLHVEKYNVEVCYL